MCFYHFRASMLYIRWHEVLVQYTPDSAYVVSARWFVQDVWNGIEASSMNLSPFTKGKLHSQSSYSIRRPQFVIWVKNIIVANLGTSIRAIARDLKISECTMQNKRHRDIRYMLYVMTKGYFLPVHTQKLRFLQQTRLQDKLKHPQESDMFCLLDDDNFGQK